MSDMDWNKSLLDKIAAQDKTIEQQAAQIEAKDHQLRAAKTIIAGLEERVLSLSQITGPLMQAAADVAGERAANALLTSEVEALRADAERWDRWVRVRVSAGPSMPGSPNTFRLPLPPCPPSVMRGSVSQHLDAAIDAALRQEQPAAIHASDCAIHNAPAYPAGPCDCGVSGGRP